MTNVRRNFGRSGHRKVAKQLGLCSRCLCGPCICGAKKKACGCVGDCPPVAHCGACKEPTFVQVQMCDACLKKMLRDSQER